MARYNVRNFRPDDFDTVMELERKLFGDCNDGTLGAYYVRLCCDFFSDSCFLVEAQGEPVGYLLSFIKGREAYCTTLAILPPFQGSRVITRIIKAFVTAIMDRVDLCWFTVEEDNKAARALHSMLGAQEVEVREDFYGEGRARIVSCIDRPAFEQLKGRFAKLGLVDASKVAQAPEVTRGAVA